MSTILNTRTGEAGAGGSAAVLPGRGATLSPALPPPSTVTPFKVALLLFCSGTCALIYQMAWLREFRLVFGASTAASAAVLAIFMGGLGLGSLVLGGRADRQRRPLGFYARLELVIAASAALTPLLLWLVRKAYLATGGSPVLGLWGATAVRLLLASLVLLVPTFLMGGTLPAAARSVGRDDDPGRRNLSFLYGLNTLGAVTGTLLATFFLLETFGTRKTLWIACLANALVAVVALSLSRSAEGQDATTAPAGTSDGPDSPASAATTKATSRRPKAAARPLPGADPNGDAAEPRVPPAFVLTAAAVVGFAFLLMELVWYRILSPILGGSTFTFGLILAAALLGMGLGGAAYATLRGNRTATVAGFALTCAFEAVFVAIPFALGDGLALTAMLLRGLSSKGFYGLVGGWALVTTLAVLPAAFMSGVQFPMLIALLGRGRHAVGRHVGLAYASNTFGAIAGSLAGGFLLLPLLTSTGTWRLVVVLLALLSLAALLVSLLGAPGTHPWRAPAGPSDGAGAAAGGGVTPGAPAARRAWRPALVAVTAAVTAMVLLLATGPTAAWRHGGIGAGRADDFGAGPNQLRAFLQDQRRHFIHEWEGVESSVGVSDNSGLALYVNGKCDGHIRGDAGTQVMAGLSGAILHGSPRTAMVIGLGTGSTAGWMAAAPTMERVDVIELEPAVLHVARLCEDGNRHVLHNPKVKITIGDAREALLVSRGKYDLIFSEPSNPYRAGVASLYTKEFYEAAAAKMQPGALFLQWVQAYEVDGQTMRTVYATCHSVFPHLETWQTQAGDLLLVGSVLPVRHDAAALRRRVAEEPFRTALADVWRVTDLEGFLSHHIADAAFAADVAKAHAGPLNTDDQTVVEFGFARSVGKPGGVSTAEVLQLAQVRGQGRPAVEGAVDWESVEDQRVAMEAYEGRTPSLPPDAPEHRRTRAEALNHLLQGNAAAGVNTWDRQPRPAASVIEMIFLASALGDTGNDRAEAHLANVRKVQETEADALLANLRWRQRRPIEAAEALQRALVRYRTDPWPHPDLMHRTIALATDVALGDRDGNVARALHDALSRPFSLRLNEDFRLRALVMVSGHLDYVTGSLLLPAALDHFEPHVPWEERFLEMRMVSYRDTNSPKLAQAILDYDEFGSNKPFPFDRGLRPASAPTTATAPTGSTATGGAATGGAATGPATAPNAGPRVEPAPAGPSQGRGESLLGPPGANPPSGNAPRPKSQR